MTVLREILQDKIVNGFIVAVVIGIATINLIGNVGGMILDHVFGVATSPWNWKIFYGQLILYFMAIIAAALIRKRLAK